MKRILFVIATLLLGFTATLSAQTEDVRTQLEAAVAEANKALPEKADQGMSLENIELNDFLHVLMFNFTLTKDAGVTAQDLQNVSEMLRPSLVAGMKTDPDNKELIDLVKKSGLGIGFQFVDHLGNSAIMITPNAEL